MREQFVQYVTGLINDIPQNFYIGFLSLFCIGSFLIMAICGFKKGFKWVKLLFIVEYIILLFCSTVIFRSCREISEYNIHPFWSYNAILNGRDDLVAVIIMNIVVFVPVGLLFSGLFKRSKWWMVLIVGFSIGTVGKCREFLNKLIDNVMEFSYI